MSEPTKHSKRRTRVERTMDSINDLTEDERKQIFDRLVDESFDENAYARALAKLADPMDYIAEALERTVNWGKMVGSSTGYYDIDKMTLGLAPGELTIVAGETSQGKTMLCCNIAVRMAMAGKKVVFVTLEMTKTELLSRLWNIVGFGADNSDQMEHLCENLRFQQSNQMDWRTVPYLIERAKKWGADVVFIDHLHYFVREMDDVANGIGTTTKAFKQAAIEHNLPIVLISHTRKVDKSRGKSHADIDDLRGSSYIAQDADIVLMVYQDKESEEPHIYVQLAKNRNRVDYRIGAEVRHPRDGVRILDTERDERGGYPCDSWSIHGRKHSITGGQM